MAETHVIALQSPNGPSHRSESNLSHNLGDETVEIQSSHSGTEADADNKFPIDEYRQLGSLWMVPTLKWKMTFEKSRDTTQIFECWKYDGPTELPLSPVIKSEKIKEDDIKAWVNTEPPTNEGQRPVAGYKILHMDNEQTPEIPMFQLKSQTYHALIEGFKLPPVELHMGSVGQGACGVFVEDDGSFLLIHRRPTIRTDISIILRYDPVTNITCGYIITDYGYYDDPMMDFSFFPTQFLACPHPFLLPVLIIEQTVYERFGQVDQVTSELEQIEQITGFTSNVSKKTEEIELQNIVRKLGEQHAYYSTNETSLLVLKLSVATFMRKLEYLDSETFPDAMREKLKRYVPKLKDRMEYLESTLEHTLLHGNIQTRLQAQQQVLFNLIAQADTKINISLAKDSREIAAASKQDSSAMKIIAMLTTLFLPGTFVATIFAMPLFEWQHDSINRVTSQHFWIYWAVTGPLTLATMALVVSWAIWNRSHLRAEVWRARKGTEKLIVENSSSNEEIKLDHENREGSAKRSEKQSAKAILRPRLWRSVNAKKQNDPESLQYE